MSLSVSLQILMLLAVPMLIVTALCYTPVIVQHIKLRRLKQELEEQIAAIEWRPFVITDKLGEGAILPLESSTVTFEQAMKNSEIALKSVLELMKNFQNPLP